LGPGFIPGPSGIGGLLGKRRHGWLIASAWAAAVAVVLLLLLFPVSCSADDGPPGAEPTGVKCPRAETLAGLEWPNMYVGFAVAPLLALVAGGGAALVVVRRREAGSS
jgi:hypothetical protein